MVQTQNSVWGPPLWRILHTFSYKIGANRNSLVAEDEARTWIQLLRSIEAIMPCQLCRRHFRTWKIHHPIEAFAGLRSLGLAEASADWLWRLHDGVNKERGVEGLTKEDAAAFYTGRTREDFQQDIEALAAVLTTATQTGQIKPEAVRIFRATLVLLRRLTGV
jgi:hypothetical protein